MTFEAFIEAVENLALEHAAGVKEIHAMPREQLQAIFDEVREQAVHDLAEAVRSRDLATRTHGMLITIDRKEKR